MPQLMPLNWVFSMFMLLLLLVSAVMIYSNSFNFIEMNKVENKMNNIVNWYW